jgi:hypothetical protein
MIHQADLMSDFDEATVSAHLRAANSVLFRLDSLDARDGNIEIERVLRDALEFYASLLEYQMKAPREGESASRIHNVADRIP